MFVLRTQRNSSYCMQRNFSIFCYFSAVFQCFFRIFSRKLVKTSQISLPKENFPLLFKENIQWFYIRVFSALINNKIFSGWRFSATIFQTLFFRFFVFKKIFFRLIFVKFSREFFQIFLRIKIQNFQTDFLGDCIQRKKYWRRTGYC